MRELNHSRVDVLKVDIEGGEWSVLPAFAATLSEGRVCQLMVEIHVTESVSLGFCVTDLGFG